MDPTTTLQGPALGSEGQACSQCGAELSADQRYCLNCGRRRADMRLPFLAMTAPAHATAPVATTAAVQPGPRSALVPLAGLIALLLALGIGVLIGRGTGSSETQTTAAQPPVITVATPSVGATTAPATVVSDWPAGTEGFAIQLRTLASAATVEEVTQAKTLATTQGATSVGALRSDEYPSLTPAQIVIYSGTFTDRAGAATALKSLRKRFPDAKVVSVSRTAAASGAAPGTTTPAPAAAAPKADSASKLTPKEFQKRSRAIPDEVQSKGTAPPADNAAPGGDSGGDGTEIG